MVVRTTLVGVALFLGAALICSVLDTNDVSVAGGDSLHDSPFRKAARMLEEDDHDHDHDHSTTTEPEEDDHDHDHNHSTTLEPEGDDHDSHDHGTTITETEGDGHDSHDHSETEGDGHDSHDHGETEGDDHDSHNHSTTETEGDAHDSHDHGETEGDDHDSHHDGTTETEGDGHDSHEHGEIEGDDHDSHNHSTTETEGDGHDSHDHGETEGDDHDSHDHGTTETQGDGHDSHDHGETEGDGHDSHDHGESEGDDHDSHDHDDDHDSHDHGETDGDDHDSHDHGDDHDSHDHGDDHDGHDHGDDHGCHDHGTMETDPHAGHDHGSSEPWAWTGAFDLKKGEKYTWSAARASSGAYAACALKFVMVSADSAAADDIEGAHSLATQLWEQPADKWIQVAPKGGTLPMLGQEHDDDHGDDHDSHDSHDHDRLLSSTVMKEAYLITLDPTSWLTMWQFNVPSSGTYVIFMDHEPTEFETDFHYLKDAHGHDIEPLGGAEEETKEKKFGLVIAASFLTTIPALCMVAFLGPLLRNFNGILPPPLFAFASGAIFSCALFLLLAEAVRLSDYQQDEVTGTWTWGTSLMIGWLTGLGIKHLCDIIFGPEAEVEAAIEAAEAQASNAEAGGDQATTELKTGQSTMRMGVIGPVILGDFFHNFVDGIVIGFAANNCNTSFVWTIAAIACAHEAPQELADFVILIRKGRMKWYWACLSNYLSSLSTLIGGLIGHGVDVSANFEGWALAYGGGVYLYVAITDLSPQISNLNHGGVRGLKQSLLLFFLFALGALCIGLVLLNHEHCVVEGGAHEGHNHGGGEEDAHAGHDHR